MLEKAANQVKGAFGDLATPRGTYARLKRNGLDLPSNGADGSLGIFRVANANFTQGLTANINSGDSWVGVIEFGKRVHAKVLLSYGNWSQAKSITTATN